MGRKRKWCEKEQGGRKGGGVRGKRKGEGG